LKEVESDIASAKNSNLDFWLKRLARYSAYALLIGVVVLLVSGWGITQTGIIYKISFHLIDRKVANSIHRATNFPLAFFFLSHVLINVRLGLSRNHPGWTKWSNVLLILLGAAVLAAVVYMEYFRLGG
jgi:hypothetical protein